MNNKIIYLQAMALINFWQFSYQALAMVLESSSCLTWTNDAQWTCITGPGIAWVTIEWNVCSPAFTSYFHYIERSKDIAPKPHSVFIKHNTNPIVIGAVSLHNPCTWLGPALPCLSSHPCLTSIFWCKSSSLENTVLVTNLILIMKVCLFCF